MLIYLYKEKYLYGEPSRRHIEFISELVKYYILALRMKDVRDFCRDYKPQ